MFERFSKTAREVVKQAQELAAAEGATSVEAHHLLIAAAEARDSDTAASLSHLGINGQTIDEARAREFRKALTSVGIDTSSQAPLGSSRLRRSTPRFGQSAKLVLQRTIEEATNANAPRITERHLVLGIVSAEAGTTPRLLNELHVTAGQIRGGLS
jgi:ATP-dependent Clp protease ATP-binding subunit ClpA